jgi:uncharacterized protein (TIGR02284 family)
MANHNPTKEMLDRLIELCRASERRHFDAAQHARNRALKLILKTSAEQRSRFGAELAELSASDQNTPNQPDAATAGLDRGASNLRSWFTLRRQRRQRVAMQNALNADTEAIAAYEEAINQNPAPAVATVLNRQLGELRLAAKRLAAMSAPSTERTLLVRLYEEDATADQVVRTLQENGVPRDQIYSAPVEQAGVYAKDNDERTRSRGETWVAGALWGGLLGLVVMLPFAIAQRLFLPQLPSVVLDGPYAVMIEWLLAATIAGAFIGSVFSLLIGQDIAEDDAYLYEESLEHGRRMVAVFTAPEQRASVEQILGLRHQFEVDPVPAV